MRACLLPTGLPAEEGTISTTVVDTGINYRIGCTYPSTAALVGPAKNVPRYVAASGNLTCSVGPTASGCAP